MRSLSRAITRPIGVALLGSPTAWTQSRQAPREAHGDGTTGGGPASRGPVSTKAASTATTAASTRGSGAGSELQPQRTPRQKIAMIRYNILPRSSKGFVTTARPRRSLHHRDELQSRLCRPSLAAPTFALRPQTPNEDRPSSRVGQPATTHAGTHESGKSVRGDRGPVARESVHRGAVGHDAPVVPRVARYGRVTKRTTAAETVPERVAESDRIRPVAAPARRAGIGSQKVGRDAQPKHRSAIMIKAGLIDVEPTVPSPRSTARAG